MTAVESYELGLDMGGPAGFQAGEADALSGLRYNPAIDANLIRIGADADPAEFRRGYREAWRDNYKDGFVRAGQLVPA